MKKTRSLALVLIISLLLTVMLPFATLAEGESSESTTKDNPGITSGNATVAYCIDDDQFLYSDRIDEKVAPTVATKLVACMVAADIMKERGLNSAETIVTVTSTAIDNSGNIFDVRVPVLGLKAGSSYTAKDLLGATLVACANDAIASIAHHFGEKYLGGGINEFVARMNQKVKDLGLTQTNFVNPTGLDAPNQTSTPREVALIAAAFYQYDELVKLSNVENFSFNASSTIRNKNYLKSNYYVDGFLNKSAIGLIAGQLDKHGNYCLITATQKEGRTYIYVIMCASGMVVEKTPDEKTIYYFVDGNAYVDMNKLIGWTQNSFKLLTVATTDTIVGELRVSAGESSFVRVVPSENVEKLVLDIEGLSLDTKLEYDSSLVYKKEFNGSDCDTVDAPITVGQKVGTITYSYNGNVLATVDAVAKDNVDSDGLKGALNTAKGIMEGPMLTVLYVVLAIIGVWLVFSIVMAVVRGVNKARKKNAKKSGNKEEKGKKDTVQKPQKPKTKPRDTKGDTKELP
ncbi:MAG: D-alanyl-D-alanine carboxypeptidase [Ruminococcaceae bacterium]|nr:D-alanyl-D-alanine carboxypeptidase [Oscillospiraceae bacterium]